MASTAEAVSFGVSLDEIRAGIKILAPSTASELYPDPVVEKFQRRLIELGHKGVVADGLFSLDFGEIVSALRDGLDRYGIEPGNFIDSKLANYLFPLPTISNLLAGLLEISERNCHLRELQGVVIEIKEIFNKLDRQARLTKDSLWTKPFHLMLQEFQKANYLQPHGKIDSATYRLLKGADIRDLIMAGQAVIFPSSSELAYEIKIIKTLQSFLNQYFDCNLVENGVFNHETAKYLELAQKALGTSERGCFSAETYEKMKSVLKSPRDKRDFQNKCAIATTCLKITENLEPALRAKSFYQKLNYLAGSFEMPEVILDSILKRLNINLHSPVAIADFQAQNKIIQSGKIDKATALAVEKLVSVHWYRNLIKSRGLAWDDGQNEVNIVGLRGWTAAQGANSNEANQWNDTIAIIWKNQNGLDDYKEFTATTDPGTQNGKLKSEALAEGQYRYCLGYFKGRSGVAVPMTADFSKAMATGSIFKFNLLQRLKTFIIGSDSFAIHWMEGQNADKAEAPVGEFYLGSQVPKINHYQFKREISPILRQDPDGIFIYSLLDLSTVDG